MRQIKNICILLLLTIKIGNCQDVEFLWQVWPFSGNSYIVKIKQGDSGRTITINYSNDSIVRRFRKNDFETLCLFLTDYDFQIKGSTVAKGVFREYHETTILPETNWLLVDGNSVRKEMMSFQGYYFDPDSNKAYTEIRMMTSWTDGCTYEGYLKINGRKNEFHVFSTRLSMQDYQLNKLIYQLITKYDKKHNHSEFKRQIDINMPKTNTKEI